MDFQDLTRTLEVIGLVFPCKSLRKQDEWEISVNYMLVGMMGMYGISTSSPFDLTFRIVASFDDVLQQFLDSESSFIAQSR